jgi:general secretion pathway protein G
MSALPSPRRGFTLVELLTVIAVIGILAAILIPTVGRVRDSARASQCVSNLRQVAISLRLCANDNRGNMPPAIAVPADTYWNPNGTANLGWSANPRFTSFLPAKGDATGTRNSVLTCPANNYDQVATGTNPVSHTYAYGPGASGLNSSNNDLDASLSRSLRSIQNPGNAVLLLESRLDSQTFKTALNAIGKTGFFNSLVSTSAGDIQFWHGGGARTNVAFADGSARAASVADLLQSYPPSNRDASYQKAAGL